MKLLINVTDVISDIPETIATEVSFSMNLKTNRACTCSSTEIKLSLLIIN